MRKMLRCWWRLALLVLLTVAMARASAWAWQEVAIERLDPASRQLWRLGWRPGDPPRTLMPWDQVPAASVAYQPFSCASRAVYEDDPNPYLEATTSAPAVQVYWVKH